VRLHQRKRAGATVIECAVVYPVTFLLLLGLIVGGLGMMRYQECATLAREATRWASVHGAQYARDSGTTPPTAVDIYNQVIAPRAVGLDLTRLNYSVTWNTSNSPAHILIVNGNFVEVTNTVTVQITYHWIPEAYLGGITLGSTSVMPMSY
jgi:Flp pilus assembly protein TadG